MKPRLLIIINRFVIGGQTSDTIPLLFHLKEKYTILVLYGNKEKDEIEPLFLLDRYPGIRISKISSLKRTVNPFADFSTFFTIVKHVRGFKPHIIHTHGAKSGLSGRVAAWICKVPVRVHTFHGHLFHSYFNGFISSMIINLERLLGKVTDAVIALSDSQKAEIVHQFSVLPLQKVFVIPLGIELPAFTVQPEINLRKEYHLSEEDIAVAIISRIVPIKNHIDFLKIAVNIINAGYNNYCFFIIGDGEQRNELTHFLHQNNIPFSTPEQPVEKVRVIFTSWLTEVMKVIGEVDIVVLTSLNEGSPVSLIEAQLCGKPVVAYNVGGVKDTFVDNVSGFLVNKGDIDDFTNKLLMLGDNKELRNQIGGEGKKYASGKFSKQAEVKAIDDLYCGLLKQKSVAIS